MTAKQEDLKVSPAKEHFKAKQNIGYTHSIDGTVATIAPAGSKVTVPFNTVLEIQASASYIFTNVSIVPSLAVLFSICCL